MSKKAIAKVAMKRVAQRSSCSARGSHPLSKPALKRARVASGSRGGARKAGRGSTASDIQNKLKYMKNFVAKRKRFPSRKFALGKWGMSKSVPPWAPYPAQPSGPSNNNAFHLLPFFPISWCLPGRHTTFRT